MLACGIDNPVEVRKRMEGSDRRRVSLLAAQLKGIEHRSWNGVPAQHRARGHAALQLIVQDPQDAGKRRAAIDRLRS